MSKEKHSSQNWQDRLREHDFGYDAEAWQQMEKLLDGAPPGDGGGGSAPSLASWLPWLAGLLVLIVVAVLLLPPGSEKGTSGILPDSTSGLAAEPGTSGILPESNPDRVAEPEEKAGDFSRTGGPGSSSDLAAESNRGLDLRSESSLEPGSEPEEKAEDFSRTGGSGSSSDPVAGSEENAGDSSRTRRSEPRLLELPEAAAITPDTLRPRELALKPPVFRRWHPNLKLGVDSRGFENSLLFGAGVDYRLNDHWLITAEVHYKKWEQTPFRTFLSDTTASPSGNIIETFTDTVHRMEFVEFPLLLQYAPSPRFRLQGGVSVNLVSNQAWERQTYSAFNGGWSSYGGSVSEGIRRMDVGLILGGRVFFSSRLALEARYVQGLFDLTYDEWYKNQRTDLNSSLQLTLRIFW